MTTRWPRAPGCPAARRERPLEVAAVVVAGRVAVAHRRHPLRPSLRTPPSLPRAHSHAARKDPALPPTRTLTRRPERTPPSLPRARAAPKAAQRRVGRDGWKAAEPRTGCGGQGGVANDCGARGVIQTGGRGGGGGGVEAGTGRQRALRSHRKGSEDDDRACTRKDSDNSTPLRSLLLRTHVFRCSDQRPGFSILSLSHTHTSSLLSRSRTYTHARIRTHTQKRTRTHARTHARPPGRRSPRCTRCGST